VALGNARRIARDALLAACIALLAACGSAPKRSGGFYQDDGPPQRVPADLLRTPDATPRVEPFHPYANRPYRALGRAYTPMTEDRPLRQRGHASWYGRQFHGNRTSSGEIYDMFAMTAAHPTMPLPSYARVTHLASGTSVVVRVNDRGPFKHDRIIDLSYAAAARLGIAGPGTGEVEVVRLTHADIRAGAGAMPTQAGATVAASPRAPLPPRAFTPAPAPSVPAEQASTGVTAATSLPAAPLPAPPSPAPSAASAASAAPGIWSVQLGAFALAANADELRERIAVLLASPEADDLSPSARQPRVEREGEVHRVLIGALADRPAAQQLAARLQQLLGRDTALHLTRP
jgi:rare lipoprotein A